MAVDGKQGVSKGLAGFGSRFLEPMFRFERLRGKVIIGGLWTLFAFGSEQLIRLGSNLVLTRLLFPEAFGLMAIVNVILAGVAMFSNVGIRESVIRHERGNEDVFLDTAWTIQAVRGVLLWVAVVALAYPVASFYGDEMLAALLPVAGITAVAQGIMPIKIHSANRNLNIGQIQRLEVLIHVIRIVAMVLLAWWFRSVWALVVGGLIGAFSHAYLAHLLLPGRTARLKWNRTVAADIFRFGKWILLSSILTYFVTSADRLILGKFMTSAELGVYSIAVMLSMAIATLLKKVNSTVLYPAYSKLNRDSPDSLRQKVLKTRIVIAALFLPLLLGLTMFSGDIITVLYDPRYAAAGWMLGVLALGRVGTLTTVGSGGGALLAQGDSARFMLNKAMQSAIVLICITMGGVLGGATGIIVGISGALWLSYLPEIWAARLAGVWMPYLDAAIFLIAGVIGYFYFLAS